MKAIVVREFGPPSVLRLEDVPLPRPSAGEVVVHLRATGVNPVETYLRSGKHARLPALPWTPGTDGAGIVEAVGDGVAGLQPGDYVYTAGSRTGTYAERCICTTAQARPLPERLTFAQGAAIHVPYATAWRALLERARLRPGETVFVHGASGAVGLATVQIARLKGADVIGSAGSEAGRAAVLAAGARDVVDHRQDGHCDEVVRLSGGGGPDVIVEMLADRNLDADLLCAASKGRIVVVGSRGRIEIEPRRAMTRDLTILGMSLPNATAEEIDAIHRAILPLFADGSLVPVVRTELPLAEAARAHELVLQPGALGKIVLVQ
jgi:NADPH2:quinone reductase